MGVWRWGLHSLTDPWQAAAYMVIKCQVPQNAQKVLTVLRPWKEFLWLEHMLMPGISHSAYCGITLQPPGQHQPIKVLPNVITIKICVHRKAEKTEEYTGILWSVRSREMWRCERVTYCCGLYIHTDTNILEDPVTFRRTTWLTRSVTSLSQTMLSHGMWSHVVHWIGTAVTTLLANC